MKATLTFDLPEENSDFRDAVQAADFKSALWEIEQQLRSWEKYGHTFKDADDAVRQIREFFHQTLSEFNVSTN